MHAIDYIMDGLYLINRQRNENKENKKGFKGRHRYQAIQKAIKREQYKY